MDGTLKGKVCFCVERRVCFGESSASCWKNNLQCKYWKWPRMNCANGNSCYRIVVLNTADSYSVVYVHYVTKILLKNVKKLWFAAWIDVCTSDGLTDWPFILYTDLICQLPRSKHNIWGTSLLAPYTNITINSNWVRNIALVISTS